MKDEFDQSTYPKSARTFPALFSIFFIRLTFESLAHRGRIVAPFFHPIQKFPRVNSKLSSKSSQVLFHLLILSPKQPFPNFYLKIVLYFISIILFYPNKTQTLTRAYVFTTQRRTQGARLP